MTDTDTDRKKPLPLRSTLSLGKGILYYLTVTFGSLSAKTGQLISFNNSPDNLAK